MNPLAQEKTGQNILIKLAMLVIILAGIRAASEIVVPFLLATFFAIVLNPVVSFLMQRGWRRGLAIAVVITAIFIMLLLLVAVLASSVSEFSDLYPQLRTTLEKKMVVVQHLVGRLGVRVSTDTLVARFDPNMLMSLATTAFTQLSGMMSNIVLLFLTVVFMLFEVRHLPYKMRNALVNPRMRIASLHRALKGVTHYLALKTFVSLITGVAVWAALYLLGVQFALLWGLLAFMLNYIPNIGPILAGIPPVIQALLLNSLSDAALVAALFIAIHMVFGNMLEPRLMGHRLGLSTLVVFLSLIFWGWLLGPVGMLLSVPLTSVTRILMETTPAGSRLAIMLGAGKPRRHKI